MLSSNNKKITENRVIDDIILATMIFVIVFINIMVLFVDLAFLAEMNLEVLILLGSTALMHFALARLFDRVRGSTIETYYEHYILVLIANLIYVLYLIIRFGLAFLTTMLVINQILFFFFTIPIIYLIAAGFATTFNRSWVVIDILSQVVASYVGLFFLEYCGVLVVSMLTMLAYVGYYFLYQKSHRF
jgi:hypothetical protein